jgi:hypothetical protein
MKARIRRTSPFKAPPSQDKPNRLSTQLQAEMGLQAPENDASDSDGLIVQLSQRFRIVAEGGSDPQQWFLQRRSGQSWEAISYCASRDGLLLSIREKCIPPNLFRQRHAYPGLNAMAIAAVKALPPRFPRRN